jgi:hypothetical protein
VVYSPTRFFGVMGNGEPSVIGARSAMVEVRKGWRVEIKGGVNASYRIVGREGEQ